MFVYVDKLGRTTLKLKGTKITKGAERAETPNNPLFLLTPILKFIQIFSKEGKYSLKILSKNNISSCQNEVGRSFFL